VNERKERGAASNSRDLDTSRRIGLELGDGRSTLAKESPDGIDRNKQLDRTLDVVSKLSA
jgi:hypothetical protein